MLRLTPLVLAVSIVAFAKDEKPDVNSLRNQIQIEENELNNARSLLEKMDPSSGRRRALEENVRNRERSLESKRATVEAADRRAQAEAQLRQAMSQSEAASKLSKGQFVVSSTGGIGRYEGVDNYGLHMYRKIDGTRSATPTEPRPFIGSTVASQLGYTGVVKSFDPETGFVTYESVVAGKKELLTGHIKTLSPEVTRYVQTPSGARPGDRFQTADGDQLYVDKVFADGRVRTAYENMARRFERMGQKFDRKFSIASSAAGLARGMNQDAIETALAQGECPSVFVGSADHFAEMAKLDHDRWMQVAANCELKGKKLDFSGQFKRLMADKPAPVAQATCNSKGEVRLVHANGMTSVTQYKSETQLGSIHVYPSTRAYPSKGENVQTLKYQSAAKGWDVQWTGPSKVEESWQSLYSRLACAQAPCTTEMLQTSVTRLDDSTTPKNPFGAMASENSRALSETLLRVRKLMGARLGRPATYQEFCQMTGAKIPETVQFEEPGPPASASEDKVSPTSLKSAN